MGAKVTTKEKEKAALNRKLVDSVYSAEADKEYGLLRLAEFLHEVKENGAQVAENYEPTPEGFTSFCQDKLRTGYATAMRLIAIHAMRVRCAIDPATAEDLGYSKLRTIAGIATPDNINYWLEQAQNLTTTELEKAVKAYKKSDNPDGPKDEPLPMFKKFIFPASEEEVPIIATTLKEVGAMLGITNDTKILVYICQSYRENQLGTDHTKAVEEIRKQGRKKQETAKEEEKVPAAKTPADTEDAEGTIAEAVITEDDIIKASLPELMAYAVAHKIAIDPKIANNKTKVRSYLIAHLADNATKATDDTPVVEESPKTEQPKKKASAPEKADKKDAKKAEKTGGTKTKAAESKKAGKEVVPEEIPEDPADGIDVPKEMTIVEAITEIRSCKTKKELLVVARSYDITLEEDEIAANDTDSLIEQVVQILCTVNEEPYIPPTEDDDTDLDDMLNGD